MNQYQSRQDGAALAICLIILTLLTVLGVTAVKSSIVETRIASNMHDRQLAFEAAEAALRDAEAWLKSLDANPDATDTPQTVELDEDDNPLPNNDVWIKGVLTNNEDGDNNKSDDISIRDIDWGAIGEQYGAVTKADDIDDVAEQPRYVIELFTFIPDDSSAETLAAGKGQFYYRITARAVGATETTTKLLQTIFRIRYN